MVLEEVNDKYMIAYVYDGGNDRLLSSINPTDKLHRDKFNDPLNLSALTDASQTRYTTDIIPKNQIVHGGTGGIGDPYVVHNGVGPVSSSLLPDNLITYGNTVTREEFYQETPGVGVPSYRVHITDLFNKMGRTTIKEQTEGTAFIVWKMVVSNTLAIGTKEGNPVYGALSTWRFVSAMMADALWVKVLNGAIYYEGTMKDGVAQDLASDPGWNKVVPIDGWTHMAGKKVTKSVPSRGLVAQGTENTEWLFALPYLNTNGVVIRREDHTAPIF
jgi:hypothetical protein